MSALYKSLGKSIITWSAWSFIGVLLASIFFYWQEHKSHYSFQIEVNDVFNLIEVREPINDLEVIYKGSDIVKAKQEIKIARISIRNTGKTILQQYYDNLEAFGLRFPESNILQFAVSDASSEELARKIVPVSLDGYTTTRNGVSEYSYEDIILSKVIFEEGNFVTFRVVLMQKEGTLLSVAPLGKIANIDKIGVVNSRLPSSKDAGMPPLLALAVFLGMIAVIFGAVFVMVYSVDYLTKRSKEKKIDNFLLSLNKTIEDLKVQERSLIECYMNSWTSFEERLLKRIVEGERVVDVRHMIQNDLLTGKVSLSTIITLLIARAGIVSKTHSFLYAVVDNCIRLNDESRDFATSFYNTVIAKRKPDSFKTATVPNNQNALDPPVRGNKGCP